MFSSAVVTLNAFQAQAQKHQWKMPALCLMTALTGRACEDTQLVTPPSRQGWSYFPSAHYVPSIRHLYH